jgi:hypothetical protein
MNKLIARFNDGRMVKGLTLDFAPSKSLFHMTVATAPMGTPFPIRTEELKALFYVKDYAGDPTHEDTWIFDSPTPPGAHRIQAFFSDGEVLVGTTTAYHEGIDGFFLKPADPTSNNTLCYVFTSATSEIRLL